MLNSKGRSLLLSKMKEYDQTVYSALSMYFRYFDRMEKKGYTKDDLSAKEESHFGHDILGSQASVLYQELKELDSKELAADDRKRLEAIKSRLDDYSAYEEYISAITQKDEETNAELINEEEPVIASFDNFILMRGSDHSIEYYTSLLANSYNQQINEILWFNDIMDDIVPMQLENGIRTKFVGHLESSYIKYTEALVTNLLNKQGIVKK